MRRMLARTLRIAALASLLVSASACIIIPIPTGGGSPSPDSPLVLRSDCAHTVYVLVGDRPEPGAPKTPLAPKTKTSIVRRSNGTATIWLFDESGVEVGGTTTSAEMRKAVVDKSCSVIAED